MVLLVESNLYYSEPPEATIYSSRSLINVRPTILSSKATVNIPAGVISLNAISGFFFVSK